MQQTVLKSCSKVPAVYLQLEPVLLPFLAMIFQMEGSDFLEDAIDAVTCLTYFGEITENTWQMYNYLLQALMTYAPDYASEILAPLDNFISLSTEKFLTGDRLQNLCAVLERVLPLFCFASNIAAYIKPFLLFSSLATQKCQNTTVVPCAS